MTKPIHRLSAVDLVWRTGFHATTFPAGYDAYHATVDGIAACLEAGLVVCMKQHEGGVMVWSYQSREKVFE